MKVICITGTPGTGKTTLAKKLSKKLRYVYVDVNQTIKKYRLSEGYDKKRRTKIIDIKKLNKVLIKEIKHYQKQKVKGIIIDSHLSHELPKRYVDLCLVTKCDLKVLEKRLKKKGYNQPKIRENLDCEIFDICLNEALERKFKVKTVDTTKGIKIGALTRLLR